MHSIDETLEHGSLVLLRLCHRRQNVHGSPSAEHVEEVGYLGLFDGFDEYEGDLVLTNTYKLSKSQDILGVGVPLVAAMGPPQDTTFCTAGRYENAWTGHTILDTLRNWPGFESHTDWVGSVLEAITRNRKQR